MKQKYTATLLLAGIIGPIMYFLIMTTLGLLWPGYSAISNYMSELGGVESPFKNTMNIFGFMGLGISLIFFGTGLHYSLSKNIYSKITVYTSILAGIFMFLVGFFPCDAGCIDITPTGTYHTYTSIPPSLFLPLSAMASAFAFLKESARFKKWAYVFFWLGFLSMASGALSTLTIIQPYIGLAQRFGIGFSLLFVILSSTVLLNRNKLRLNKTQVQN
jgi:hypothetical membrane protein